MCLHMNYVDQGQDLVSGYGSENIKYMKRVLQKFDPDGVFSSLHSAGFKIF